MSTSNTLDNFKQIFTSLIENAESWYSLDNGRFTTYDPETLAIEDVISFSSEDLGLVDERVPQALRFIIEYSGADVKRFGKMLRTNIAHWNSPGIELFKAPCKTLGQDEVYRIAEVLEVIRKDSSHMFQLEISFYTTLVVDGLEVVSHIATSPRMYKLHELEHLFPGFEKRYDIGVSMEISPRELANYATTSDEINTDLLIPTNLSFG